MKICPLLTVGKILARVSEKKNELTEDDFTDICRGSDCAWWKEDYDDNKFSRCCILDFVIRINRKY